MAKIIVCTPKTAETPYTFLNTKVEIYTYEELCFYIYNNTVLISRNALSDKLFLWIRDELGMHALADRLMGLMNKNGFVQDLLVEILSAGEYYSPEEIKAYVEDWQRYKKLSPRQREKLKADGYLKYRRYIRAATIYDDIIENTEPLIEKREDGSVIETEESVFLGKVYHNRAVAAANNMDLFDAKKYFQKSYELIQDPRSMKGYFFAVSANCDITTLREEILKLGYNEDYFEEIMSEIGDAKDDVREMTIYGMLQRAIYNKMNKDMTDYDKRMDIILAQLKDEFREQAL